MQTYFTIGMAAWLLADLSTGTSKKLYADTHSRFGIILGMLIGVAFWPLSVAMFVSTFLSCLVRS